MYLSSLHLLVVLCVATRTCHASFISPAPNGGWTSFKNFFSGSKKKDSVDDDDSEDNALGSGHWDFNDIMPDPSFSEEDKIDFVNDFINGYYHDDSQVEKSPTPQKNQYEEEQSESIDAEAQTPENTEDFQDLAEEETKSVNNDAEAQTPENTENLQDLAEEETKSVKNETPASFEKISTHLRQPQKLERAVNKITEGTVDKFQPEKKPLRRPIRIKFKRPKTITRTRKTFENIATNVDYMPHETDSCNPQNPDDLIEPDGYDNNHIVVNFFNDTEFEVQNNIKGPYPASYTPFKRENIVEAQSKHEGQLTTINSEYPQYNPNSTEKKRSQRTKKEKQEATKAQKPQTKPFKRKQKMSGNDKKQIKSDIKIINGKSKNSININKNLTKAKKEQKKFI